MRYGGRVLGLLLLVLVGCAETQEAGEYQSDEVGPGKIRWRFGPDGVEEVITSMEGVTASCTATQDKTAAFFMVASESAESLTCGFKCIFGDPEAGTTFTLACEGVPISPYAPRAAYCRQPAPKQLQVLGSITKFNVHCQ